MLPLVATKGKNGDEGAEAGSKNIKIWAKVNWTNPPVSCCLCEKENRSEVVMCERKSHNFVKEVPSCAYAK